MEEKILLAELTKNCGEKKAKVMELLEAYDLADLGYEMQEKQCKDIYDRVLAENEFFAANEINREPYHIKVGDRITKEEFDFLLSDDDFQRLQDLALPYMVEQKITDENFYYITEWSRVLCDARCELVEYIIKEIVPKDLRGIMWENRANLTFQDKLIKITKDAFCKKSA